MRRFICQIAPLSHHCCQLDRLLSPSRRLSCSQLPNLTLAMSSKPVHILFYLPHIPLSSRFWTIRDVRMNSSCTALQRQDIFVYLTRRKVVPSHSRVRTSVVAAVGQVAIVLLVDGGSTVGSAAAPALCCSYPQEPALTLPVLSTGTPHDVGIMQMISQIAYFCSKIKTNITLTESLRPKQKIRIMQVKTISS